MTFTKLKCAPLFLIHITILVMAGCTENYNVKIQKNGQAELYYELYNFKSDTIKQIYQTEKELNETKDSLSNRYKQFYKSRLITEYSCEINNDLDVKVHCKIKNINSLGKFLCPWSAQYHPITFNYSANKLIIDAGQGDAKIEDDVTGLSNTLNFKLTIELPKKITNMKNESGLFANYSENKFSISSSIAGLNYSGKRNRIILEY